MAMVASASVQKSEEAWHAILSPEQFRVLRQMGTEYPGIGEYDKFFCEDINKCAGCGTPLYRSTTKFNSGCGSPAFYEGLPGAINRNKTAWLAIVYMYIPTGCALTYVYGESFGTHLIWRFAFWVEVIVMLPLAILGFIMKPTPLKGFALAESKKALIPIKTGVPEVQVAA